MYNVVAELPQTPDDGLRVEWWHSDQYFGLPITRSVVQFPLRTLIYALSSSYIEI